MPSFRLIIHTTAAVAALIAVALLAFSWLDARADRARLASIIATQQQVIAAADSREHDRDAALKSTLAQIAELERTVRTPQQIVQSLPNYLPLPEPIALVTAAAPQKGTAVPAPPEAPSTAPSSAQSAISNLKSLLSGGEIPTSSDSLSTSPSSAPASAPACPPGSAIIPAADLKPLYDYIQNCRACQAQLAGARSDLHDEQARSTALARERNAAVTAAKGGGFWRQLKRNAKWLAIGAGTGLVLGLAARPRL